jgi:hypothetical protein
MKFSTLIVIFLILFIKIDVNAQIEKKAITFSINANLVLTGEGNDYLFSTIKGIVADKAGNIFVADDKQGKILVFDKKGRFLKSFGSTGRGPGQFTEVTTMTMLPTNELLIFDYYQLRFTKYSTEGEVILSKAVKNDIRPVRMEYIPNEGIGLYYRNLEAKSGGVHPKHDFLLHLFDDELNELNEHYVPVSHTINISQPFERYFEGGIYRGIFAASDSILTVAPFFFRGKLLQYRNEDLSSLKNTLNGYVETEQPYKLYDNYEDVIGKGLITNSRVYGKLHGIMNNESLAIFNLSDGNYLFIGLLSIDGKQELSVQIFDAKQGEILAYGTINNLEAGLLKNGFYQRVQFYWMDDKDQLYVIVSSENGDYVIRGNLIAD